MISCDVAKDMLPLVAAGDCTDETKLIVDEHVATCAACRAELAMMKDPAVAAERIPDESSAGEISKEMTFEKGFRKIRHMWLASIVCVLCILPLTGLGVLGFNDARGEGYAYSNLEDAITLRAYLECLKNKDYEGAFAYVDTQGMYEDVTTAREDYNAFDTSNFFLATIGGKSYYVSNSGVLAAYSGYGKEGADTEVWAEVICRNVDGYYATPIPEDVFADAAEIASEILGEQIVEIMLESEQENTAYTYIKTIAVDGESYYVPTRDGRANGPQWKQNAIFIPEEIYTLFKKDQQERDNREIARMDQYRKLGLEGYTQLMKEIYITALVEKEANGFYIESYSIGTPNREISHYTSDGEEIVFWNFIVDFTLSGGAEYPTQQFGATVRDGKIIITSSITLYSQSNPGINLNYINNINPYPYIFEDTDGMTITFSGW